jgi:LysM repeat protein
MEKNRCMFKINRFLFLILILSATEAIAQKQPRKAAPALLSDKDTVLLIVQDSQKIFLHTVKPRQTLYSIAKYYGLGMEDLYAYNPEYRKISSLQKDALIKIPIPNRAIRRYKGDNFVKENYAPIFYLVEHGDNLYGICKRYFSMSADTILKRNKLKKPTIQPGQLLHIGWFDVSGIPPDWRPTAQVEPAVDTTELIGEYQQQKSNRQEVTAQGVCFWRRDNDVRGELYALHNTAMLGTIMAITNPMNNRTAYAKVIGRIPAGNDRNTEVMISPEAARRLGAIDARFFVKIKYFK